MTKIGILGGTFNPVHLGHLVMAEAARDQLELDRVYFVPSFLPPHKTSVNVVSHKHRLEMVRLALKGNKSFYCSDIEIKRKGKSYTIDTIKQFQNKFGAKEKFYFLLGEDGCEGLAKWKNINELKKLVNFVVVSRPGVSKRKTAIPVKLVNIPGLDVSSSHIRHLIKTRHSIKYLVPKAVEKYIKEKKLFR